VNSTREEGKRKEGTQRSKSSSGKEVGGEGERGETSGGKVDFRARTQKEERGKGEGAIALETHRIQKYNSGGDGGCKERFWKEGGAKLLQHSELEMDWGGIGDIRIPNLNREERKGGDCVGKSNEKVEGLKAIKKQGKGE